MIEAILGTIGSERVLIYLQAREKGYAREIARFYETSVSPVQKQLERLEGGGVLISQTAGRTRLFSFNPRYPLVKELRLLLDKTLEFYPEDVRDGLLKIRRRPRRSGKRP